MKPFADIHIHMLPGVDDGAKSLEDALQMLEAASRDGTDLFCLTPHFHPGMFGNNHDRIEQSFREFCSAAQQKVPGTMLLLGNELRFHPNCLAWIDQGLCRTMNGTSYVLVDFSEYEDDKVICSAVYKLLNGGYRPILAHAERYRNLHRDFREIRQFINAGVLIQIDGPSLFGGWGMSAKMRSRRLIKARLVDLVCSDAHDLNARPPQLSNAYAFVSSCCGEEYADDIFSNNARALLEI